MRRKTEKKAGDGKAAPLQQYYWADVTADCELHEVDQEGRYVALVWYAGTDEEPQTVTTSFQIEPGYRLRKLLVAGTNKWKWVIERQTEATMKTGPGRKKHVIPRWPWNAPPV